MVSIIIVCIIGGQHIQLRCCTENDIYCDRSNKCLHHRSPICAVATIKMVAIRKHTYLSARWQWRWKCHGCFCFCSLQLNSKPKWAKLWSLSVKAADPSINTPFWNVGIKLIQWNSIQYVVMVMLLNAVSQMFRNTAWKNAIMLWWTIMGSLYAWLSRPVDSQCISFLCRWK